MRELQIRGNIRSNASEIVNKTGQGSEETKPASNSNDRLFGELGGVARLHNERERNERSCCRLGPTISEAEEANIDGVFGQAARSPEGEDKGDPCPKEAEIRRTIRAR